MIIESDNYHAAGIEAMFFPGGEPHAKCPPSLGGDILLVLKMRSWNEVGIGACVADMLDQNPLVTRLKVFIPYFPAARQDRTNGLAPLTAAIVGRMFPMPFATFDLHSDLAAHAMVSAPYNFMPDHLDMAVRDDTVAIIAPDQGAVLRASRFQKKFYPRAELLQCNKVRNPANGEITGYTMPKLPDRGRYLIVDDICDGGRTFNLLADAFFADPLSEGSRLHMYVSHGIFSRGVNAIHPGITRIITTDSFYKSQHPSVTVLKLDQLYDRIQHG